MEEQTKPSGSGSFIVRTTNNDGSNVVDITLRVEDGQIVEMFASSNDGVKYEVRKVKFALHSESVDHSDGVDNDECRCCSRDPVTGQIRCVTCPC